MTWSPAACTYRATHRLSQSTSTVTIRRIDIAAFENDILQSPLYDFDRPTSVDDYVQLFNDEVQQIVDKHAPLKSRTRRLGRNDSINQSIKNF